MEFGCVEKLCFFGSNIPHGPTGCYVSAFIVNKLSIYLSIYLLWEDISRDPLESLTRANNFKIELAVKSYDCFIQI